MRRPGRRCSIGVDGYRELAARTGQAFTRMRQGIEAMPELRVLGRPFGPLLAYGSATPQVNIFAVGGRWKALTLGRARP
jgi:sphinganine-1-phosphate aldolase